MNVDFLIKKGDTRPALQATISAAATDVLSSVKFNMATDTGTLKVNLANGTIVQQPSTTQPAIIKYQWVTNDTDTALIYNGEFQVTFNDGRIETYPNDRYLKIQVFSDLA